jgi:hypothetical protein
VSFVCGTIRLFLTARTHEVEHIIITELGEHSVLMEPQSWAEIFDLPAFIRPDAQFYVIMQNVKAGALDA